MNSIIKHEQQIELFGHIARAHNVVAEDATGRIRNQKISIFREYWEGNDEYKILAFLGFDDEHNNGHETFSITGTILRKERGAWKTESGGCIHEDIAKHFPELVHLIKWHLTSTDGPLHYISNTVYIAGNIDCNGLLAGEKKQIINGRTKQPCWKQVAVNAFGDEIDIYKLAHSTVDADECPADTLTLKWVPWCRVGDGKERELDAARRAAVWPEATDEQLCAPKEELTKALRDRLPALLESFKADILACGFLWPQRSEQKEAA